MYIYIYIIIVLNIYIYTCMYIYIYVYAHITVASSSPYVRAGGVEVAVAPPSAGVDAGSAGAHTCFGGASTEGQGEVRWKGRERWGG